MVKSIFGDAAKAFGFGDSVSKYSKLSAHVYINEDLIREFAKGLYTAYMQTVPSHYVDNVPGVMEIEIYLKYLVEARVMQTANQRLPFKARSRDWVIPAVFFPALGMIGPVRSEEHLIDVEILGREKVRAKDQNGDEVIVFEIETYVFTDMFEKVRDFMVSVEGQHTVAYGLPVEITGHFEFMMFQIVEEKISHFLPKVDPAAALVASFIHANVAQTIFTPRFIYGTCDDATRVIRHMTIARSLQ